MRYSEKLNLEFFSQNWNIPFRARKLILTCFEEDFDSLSDFDTLQDMSENIC